MYAEDSYQFTHAMLREVAYQLQLPSDRARLHEFAHDILADEPDEQGALAFDLAEHARFAAQALSISVGKKQQLETAEAMHLERAALAARRDFRNLDEYEILNRLSHNVRATIKQRIGAMCSLATVCLALGRNDQAGDFARQATVLCAEAALPIQADTLSHAGITFTHLHRTAEAQSCFQQALKAAKTSGNKAALCKVLGGWSTLKQHSQDWANAAQLLQQALALADELDDSKQRKLLTSHLGILHWHEGRFDQAEQIYLGLLGPAYATNDLSTQCNVVGNLGALRNSQGRRPEAVALLTQAISLSHRLGDRRRELVHMGNLATALKLLGERQKCHALQLEAIGMAREIGDIHALSLNTGNMAILLHEEHRYEQAHAAYLDALKAAQDINHTNLVAMWLCHIALLGTLSGDLSLETEYARKAKAVYEAMGKPDGMKYFDKLHKATLDERELVLEFSPRG